MQATKYLRGILGWLVIFSNLALAEQVKLLRVVDGDTLKVTYHGRKEALRLIGIDTPESAVNKKAERDSARSYADLNQILSLGQRAKEHTELLVSDENFLNIEFDVVPRDQYGRLLAYVYLSDGSMLNEKIIQDGFAKPYTFPPNVRYISRFRKAAQDARKHARGLWGINSNAFRHE